eukprot:g8538.t1
MEREDGEIEGDDELSAMAWELAARGKGGRDIAQLHESWAAALVVRGGFDEAQEHLDHAAEAWTGYNEPVLLARVWCLKASCNAEAGEFPAAAACLKTAQKLAEGAGDVPLMLCAMSNRAICEIRLGDCKAAATRSRRAFVRAEAENDPEMILKTQCIRASCYLMAGNFLAACNEYESASRLVKEGRVLPPSPVFSVDMDTNFGISVLRSGRPGRASVLFERALDTVRSGKLIVGGGDGGGTTPALLTLARCLFHAGEARRQNRELGIANAFLEEAAAIVATESSAAESEDSSTADQGGSAGSDRPKWAALAIEVANSRGLCSLAQEAKKLSAEPRASTSAAASKESIEEAPTVAISASSRGNIEAAAAAVAGRGTDPDRVGAAEAAEAGGGRAGSIGNAPSSTERRRSLPDGRAEETAASRAARLIAAGCKAGEAGAHPTQKANGAVLEGLAWSLAGRGAVEGASAMKRAERSLEKIFDRERRAPGGPGGGQSRNDDPSPSAAARASEAVGVSVPAGSESGSQLQMLQLGVLCSQGSVARGGLGMGAGFCTSAVANGPVPGKGKEGGAAAAGDAAGALAAVAAARTSARATAAGWAEAGSLAKKQLTLAAQARRFRFRATTASARQLSLAHAHGGAVELMTGKPAEAAERFERQLEEARKAGDHVLEAIAERNLADARDAEEDLPGALRSPTPPNTLTAAGVLGGSVEKEGGRRQGTGTGDGDGDGGVPETGDDPAELHSGATPPEAEIEEREDNDLEFLKATAAERARLFAERYEAAVYGLEWPVSGGAGGSGGEEGGEGELDGGGGDPDGRRRSGGSGGGGVFVQEAAAVAAAVAVA